MNLPHKTLEELFDDAWRLLVRGKNDRKHPFNLAVLCSSSPPSHPRSRTLVLRNVLKDKAELWCYTDRRSRKAQALTNGSAEMSWTFWSPGQRIQVTAIGHTEWLNPARTADIFNSLPKHSRKAYATLLPPGSPTDGWTEGLPANWEDLKLAETEYARTNFGVMVTTIHEMDVLRLSREGHRRMRGLRSSNNEWKLEWLVP